MATVAERPTLSEVARFDDPAFYASESHDVSDGRGSDIGTVTT